MRRVPVDSSLDLACRGNGRAPSCATSSPARSCLRRCAAPPAERTSARTGSGSSRSSASSTQSSTVMVGNSAASWNERMRPRLRACLGLRRVTSAPCEVDRARVGLCEPAEQLEQRRLAGTVRPDEPERLAGSQLEVHAVDGTHAAVLLRRARWPAQDRPRARTAPRWRRDGRQRESAPGGARLRRLDIPLLLRVETVATGDGVGDPVARIARRRPHDATWELHDDEQPAGGRREHAVGRAVCDAEDVGGARGCRR